MVKNLNVVARVRKISSFFFFEEILVFGDQFWGVFIIFISFFAFVGVGNVFFCVFGILAGCGGIRVSDPLQKNKKYLVRGYIST